MRPVVSVEQMRHLDATSSIPESELIERAGAAVARAAKRMLGGTYGRRVVAVCGKGNNGADGRVAARRLRASGVVVTVVEPKVDRVPSCDLVIDAAYGTGFSGEYSAPSNGDAPVLAVDIPSGVDGSTGLACDHAVRAQRTITFAALKPGLLLNDGPEHAGEVEVVDIGLDPGNLAHETVKSLDSVAQLLEDADVRTTLGPLRRESHKWKAALAVIAGSPGMLGAPSFAVRGAQRAGAGMVRLGVPGLTASNLPVGEAVAIELPGTAWYEEVLASLDRVHVAVIGPGLGRSEEAVASIRKVVEAAEIPLVIDGDGLFAVDPQLLRLRRAPTILTPHDGEYRRLRGHEPGEDRIANVRQLAHDSHSTVLLKGSTTVVAGPDGEVRLSATGDARLATAGTGDVLSGIVGALVALGHDPLIAAAMAAHVHGAAAKLGYSRGFIASDLPELVAKWLSV